MSLARLAGWDDVLARRDVVAVEDALDEVARRRHELALTDAALAHVAGVLDAARESFYDHDSFAGSGLTRDAAATVVDELLEGSHVGEGGDGDG